MAKNHRKHKVLEALQISHGIVTAACKSAHVTRKTYYSWLKKDALFKAQVDQIQDVALDFVESKLLTNIESGNVLAQMFYLKCRGKSRGFVEKVESDISGTLKLDIVKRIIKTDDECDKK